jgi:hypothetical protein
MPETAEIGPVDYLLVRFPGSHFNGEALPLLADLQERGIIKVLDLQVVKRETDDTLTVIDISDVDGDGALDLTVFEGAATGLLDQEDADKAGSFLEPGDTAALLVYENAWAEPFAAALRRAGAELVSDGRIPVTDVIEVLDALDSAGA